MILISLLTVLTAVSCNGGDGEAALAAFKTLYAESVKINEYVFGAGLPYDGEYDLESLSSPYYVEVSEGSPYKTKAELEAAVLSVYSKGYYNNIRQSLFDGYGEDSDVKPRYKEVGGVLKIDITNTGYKISGVFDTENATVKDVSSSDAIISAIYSVEGQNQKEYELTLVLENGEWRFDAPTY